MNYSGIYKGIVVDNNDPQQLCRLRVWIPIIHGERKDKEFYTWAQPCLPYGGGKTDSGEEKDNSKQGYGFVFLPPVESEIWVMFENGSPLRPIWLGFPYEKGKKNPETPESALENYPNRKVIKVPSKNNETEILIDSSPSSPKSSITIKVSKDTRLTLEADENNKIILASTGDIDIKSRGDINLTSEETLQLIAKAIKIYGLSISTGLADKEQEITEVSEDDRKNTGGVRIYSADTTAVQAGDNMRGAAPNVSGFESHSSNKGKG